MDHNKPLKIITVTTFYPNAADPHRTVFVRNLVEELSSHCQISVISPVPYVPLFALWFLPQFAKNTNSRAKREIPDIEKIGLITVTHPRFIIMPRIEILSGVSYMIGVFRALRSEARDSGRVIVHAHCAYPDGVGVAIACSLLRLPFVVTAHGSDLNIYGERRGLRYQMGWALRRAAGVVVVSRKLREKAIALLADKGSLVTCIPCAAYNCNVFSPGSQDGARQQLGLPLRKRLLLFVGNFLPVKGLDVLVSAWSQLQESGLLTDGDCLVLIGKGPCRQDLELQVHGANLSGRVRFVEPVEQGKIALWMRAADIFCLPSRNEGTPNVVVEALACALPVVATDVGGVPELISEGINGFLVPVADSVALTDALQRAFSYSWKPQNITESVQQRTWATIAALNYAFLNGLT